MTVEINSWSKAEHYDVDGHGAPNVTGEPVDITVDKNTGKSRSNSFDAMAGLLENGEVVDELRTTVDINQTGDDTVPTTQVRLSFSITEEQGDTGYQYRLYLNSNIPVNTDVTVSGYRYLCTSEINPTDDDFRDAPNSPDYTGLTIKTGQMQSDRSQDVFHPNQKLTCAKITWDSDSHIKVTPQMYNNYYYNKPGKLTEYF